LRKTGESDVPAPRPHYHDTLIDAHSEPQPPQRRNRVKETMGASIWASVGLQKMFAPPSYAFQGTFDEAVMHARKENKWLLVNIQDCTVFESHELNRSVWSNAEVKHLIEASFVLWQAEITSPDGKEYRRLYSVEKHRYPASRKEKLALVCDQLPFIAVIDPRTREEHPMWGGYIDPGKLTNYLTQFVSEHDLNYFGPPPASASLVPAALVKASTVAPQLDPEDEQLQAAIELSLGASKSSSKPRKPASGKELSFGSAYSRSIGSSSSTSSEAGKKEVIDLSNYEFDEEDLAALEAHGPPSPTSDVRWEDEEAEVVEVPPPHSSQHHQEAAAVSSSSSSSSSSIGRGTKRKTPDSELAAQQQQQQDSSEEIAERKAKQSRLEPSPVPPSETVPSAAAVAAAAPVEEPQRPRDARRAAVEAALARMQKLKQQQHQAQQQQEQQQPHAS